jgi:hypothetical protein
VFLINITPSNKIFNKPDMIIQNSVYHFPPQGMKVFQHLRAFFSLV